MKYNRVERGRRKVSWVLWKYSVWGFRSFLSERASFTQQGCVWISGIRFSILVLAGLRGGRLVHNNHVQQKVKLLHTFSTEQHIILPSFKCTKWNKKPVKKRDLQSKHLRQSQLIQHLTFCTFSCYWKKLIAHFLLYLTILDIHCIFVSFWGFFTDFFCLRCEIWSSFFSFSTTMCCFK